MSKHTPGPWRITTALAHCFGHDDELAVECEGGAVVAGVWPMGDDDVGIHEAHANARLIAAAPELADFLSSLLDLDGPAAIDALTNNGPDVLARALEDPP